MKLVGRILIAFLVVTVSVLLKGYTLTVLWEWFVLNTFNLPPLNIPTAIGLALLVEFLTHQYIKGEESKETFGYQVLEAFLKVLFKCLIALAFGAVIVQFM